MKKTITLPIIAVLAVALVISIIMLVQQTGKLTKARAEIGVLSEIGVVSKNVSTLEGVISALKGEVSDLQGNIASLQTKLANSDAKISTLENGIESANSTIKKLQGDIAAQQNTNSTLSADLKKIRSPRHFQSSSELIDWLNKDNTNIAYKGQRVEILAYILQVRALRDGYLLPANYWGPIGNVAVISDNMYLVSPDTDVISQRVFASPLPAYPLPPE